jgi:hypothetical protein
MKLETLRELIKKIPTTSQEEEHVINNVLGLIDLYEHDNKQPVNPTPPSYPIPKPNGPPPSQSIPIPRYLDSDNTMVPYHEVCSCNPLNGGSGICACTIGNRLVPRSLGKL